MKLKATLRFAVAVAGLMAQLHSSPAFQRRPPEPPRAVSARLPAVRAAGADDQRSLDVMRTALESRDYAVRLVAVEALGQVRSADVLPWLRYALGDPEHDVRIAAVEALRRLGFVRARDL